MKKGFKSKLICALVIVLAVVMVFGGCKKKTSKEILAEAMEQTVKAAESKTALLGSDDNLRNGLFTVNLAIGAEGEGINVKLLFKDKKVAIDSDLFGKVLGVDLEKFVRNFPTSAFGTKGGNLMGITEDDQNKLLEAFDKFVNSLDGMDKASVNLVDEIEKYSSMKTDYNKSVELSSGNKKVNIVTLAMTAGQVQDLVKELASKSGDIASMTGIDLDQMLDAMFDEDVDKNAPAADIKLYTDTKTSEILGGVIKLLGVDEDEEDEEFKFEVDKTDDSIDYRFSGDDGATMKFGIANKDNVETIRLAVDYQGRSDDYLKVEINGNTKKIDVSVFGSSVLEIGYDITRYADNTVKSFSAEIDLSQLAGLLGGTDSYDEDYYDYEEDVYYDDQWDDGEWDDDYWDDDDYYGDSGFGMFGGLLTMLSGKITVNFDAEGTIPEFSDVLEMSENDLQQLLSNVLSMFGFVM